VAGRATIDVELQARNGVTSISVVGNSLPADGVTAGTNTVICIQVTSLPLQSMPRCMSQFVTSLIIVQCDAAAAPELLMPPSLAG